MLSKVKNEKKKFSKNQLAQIGQYQVQLMQNMQETVESSSDQEEVVSPEQAEKTSPE